MSSSVSFRTVSEDVLIRHSGGESSEHIGDCNAQPANTRPPAALAWLERDGAEVTLGYGLPYSHALFKQRADLAQGLVDDGVRSRFKLLAASGAEIQRARLVAADHAGCPHP